MLGSGDPVVLVHGTRYSSVLWRDIAPALALTRRVFVFDLLGYGQSDQHEGQDLSIAAQAKVLRSLLDHWDLPDASLVAHDIGGAVTLRSVLLEGADCRDLTLFDAVSGGEWERGLFQLILEHAEVFEQLPDDAHEALVATFPWLCDPWAIRPKSGLISFCRLFPEARRGFSARRAWSGFRPGEVLASLSLVVVFGSAGGWAS